METIIQEEILSAPLSFSSLSEVAPSSACYNSSCPRSVSSSELSHDSVSSNDTTDSINLDDASKKELIMNAVTFNLFFNVRLKTGRSIADDWYYNT